MLAKDNDIKYEYWNPRLKISNGFIIKIIDNNKIIMFIVLIFNLNNLLIINSIDNIPALRIDGEKLVIYI